MILIAVVALGLMFGMPYLMDNSMFHPYLSPSSISRSESNPLLSCNDSDADARYSGSGDEEGIRRTAEEEYIERWGESGESVAGF